MKSMKAILPSGSNKMLFVITFILGLLPFSGQNNSVAAQRAQPARTELVIARKAPAKKLVNFFFVADNGVVDDRSNSSLVFVALSGFHSRLATIDDRPFDNHSRQRSRQMKLLPADDEDSLRS